MKRILISLCSISVVYLLTSCFQYIFHENLKWLFHSLIPHTCTYIIDEIVFSRNKLDVFRDTLPYLNKVPFYSKDTIEDKALYNSRIALSTVRSILNLIFRRRSSTASLYSKEIPRFTCILHCSIRNWKTDCF